MNESTQIVSVETAKATGRVLDWGLAVALKYPATVQFDTVFVVMPYMTEMGIDEADPFFHTWNDTWSVLIEQHKISLIHEYYHKDGCPWVAKALDVGSESHHVLGFGATPAEAVVRCVVAMFVGENFKVPKELV